MLIDDELDSSLDIFVDYIIQEVRTKILSKMNMGEMSLLKYLKEHCNSGVNASFSLRVIKNSGTAVNTVLWSGVIPSNLTPLMLYIHSVLPLDVLRIQYVAMITWIKGLI